MENVNEFGQPIGYPVPYFKMPTHPNFDQLAGNAATVVPISKGHLSPLFKAFSLDVHGRNWTYLMYGPFPEETHFMEWANEMCFGQDPKFYTLFNSESRPAGFASLLRIDAKVGSIELGHIHLSPLLQRTRSGTECLMLMIEWAFEAGYRRVEWKCDALNTPSRRAAQRFGFSYEGTFRHATIYKSRNRDTSWFAATSQDWPKLKKAYQAWRDPNNFTSDDREIKKLSQLTAETLITPS